MWRWIKSNRRKSGVFAALALVVVIASWAEMAGRFDEPCPQRQSNAEIVHDEPGVAASIANEGAAYRYSPESAKECEEPDWWNIPFEGWVALFTVLLFVSTTGLWTATHLLGERADRGLRTLERAYIFAGPVFGIARSRGRDSPRGIPCWSVPSQQFGKDAGLFEGILSADG